MTSFPTIYLGLRDLSCSFSTDGKRCLVERWQDLLMLLHDGELPNDWRFQATCALAHSFLECAEEKSEESWNATDFQDVIGDVVDRLVDDYNGALLAWAAEVPSRAVFSEPERWSFEDAADIIERVRARQFEVIEEMAWHLISYLDENLSE